MTRGSRQAGFALLLVIWGIGAIAFLVLNSASLIQTHTKSIGNAIEAARAEALADAGVALAIAELSRLIERSPAGAIKLTRKETSKSCAIDERRSIETAVEDEGGKIDLNTASDELVAALFQSIGLNRDEAWSYVDRIVDFRDEDDLRRAGGAEAMDYSAAGKNYGPKNSPFESVRELEQVLHLDPRRLDMVWPFLTVYSRQRGVDVTVADVSLPLLGNPRKRGVPLSEAFLQPSRKQAYLVRSIGHEGPETTFVREAILEFSMQNKVEVRIREWRRGERVALSTGQRKVIAEAASDRRGLVFCDGIKNFQAQSSD